MSPEPVFGSFLLVDDTLGICLSPYNRFVACVPVPAVPDILVKIVCRTATRLDSTNLLQFGVLGLGLLQDGDVRVGIFPYPEEVLVRRLGLGVEGFGAFAV
jgi:hypothetical protein